MAERIIADPTIEFAPEPPPQRVTRWLRENLFSTVASSIASIAAIALVLFAIRGILAFVFNPARRWDAVTYNTRLLMIQAYPRQQTMRVWVSVGIVVVLLAATLAFYRIGGRVSRKRIGTVLAGGGGMVLIAGILGPFSAAATAWWVGISAAAIAAGWVIRTAGGERAKQATVPILGVVLALLALLVAVMWVIDVPVPFKDDAGVQSKILAPIATSTTIPWTVLAAIGVVVYLVSAALRDRVGVPAVRRVLVALWVMSFPAIVLVVLRDPALDYGRVLRWYLPVAVGFIVVGGLIINYIAGPGSGELGRVLGAALLMLGLGSFLIPMEYVVRFLLLLLAVYALAAPTFGGEGQGRRRFLALWAATAGIVTYLLAILTAPSTVQVPGSFFLGGLSLTVLLAVTTIVASFPLGILLALGRTSTMPIFRIMSTVYIEVVRGVPLITLLLVMFIIFPVALPPGVEVSGVVRAVIAMTFFSAAYLAENVRGGLQSIGKGQYEASKALGMTTAQMTVFITLPQALRAVIPALVGQVIALFKDTSLVTIVGLFDFLHIARQIIPAQSQPFSFLGSIKETLLFAAIVYWIFTFTFSRISQRLEKRLGVGER
jgi:general L-amino acid transport system permease protein